MSTYKVGDYVEHIRRDDCGRVTYVMTEEDGETWCRVRWVRWNYEASYLTSYLRHVTEDDYIYAVLQRKG